MNTSEFLAISTAIVPDRTALVFEGRRTTYEELQSRVNRLAAALGSLGVGPGDRIGVIQVNTDAVVEAYFAAAKLDAVFVPLNFRARADELSFMVQDSGPKVLLAGSRYVKMVDEILDGGNIDCVEHRVALEDAADGWLSYSDLIDQADDDELWPTADDEDLAILLFTSGTTSLPKGVMLSHNSFSSYVLSHVTPADPDSDERNILTVPMYHIAGMQAMISAIYGGRTLIIQRQFDPKSWMELVEDESADRAMMVPTMLKMLMDHEEFHDHDMSSLRVITYGAAPMPVEVIRRAIGEFPNAQFINAFGQTETAATITMLPPEDHVLTGAPEEVERKLKRLSSIGKPLADVDVRIVDEGGVDTTIGEVGEIVARGRETHEGLLGPGLRHGGDDPRRMAIHRRPRILGRGRLHLPRGQVQRLHQARRRDDLPRRGREGAALPPRHRRSRHHRDSRRRLGRAREGCRRCQVRPRSRRGRRDRILSPAARQLQEARVRSSSRRAAPQPDGQRS